MIKSTADKISANLEKELTSSMKQEEKESQSAEEVKVESDTQQKKDPCEAGQSQGRRKKTR